MIDVKHTILKNLDKAFYKLRFLGKNNVHLFKRILFLIVLDDLYDWSACLDEKQSVQKRLQDLRTKFLSCNRDIEICSFPNDMYVNVNTPQTNNTWKRIWDNPDVKFAENGTFEFIYLSDLSDVKVINGKHYVYSDTVPMNDDGQIHIFENNTNQIDQQNYIVK